MWEGVLQTINTRSHSSTYIYDMHNVINVTVISGLLHIHRVATAESNYRDRSSYKYAVLDFQIEALDHLINHKQVKLCRQGSPENAHAWK